MSGKSFLIQETVNNILLSLPDSIEGPSIVLKDNTLAKQFNVSRTTIRTAIQALEKLGIIEVIGNAKTVVRTPNADDYFDISDQVSTKEEIIDAKTNSASPPNRRHILTCHCQATEEETHLGTNRQWQATPKNLRKHQKIVCVLPFSPKRQKVDQTTEGHNGFDYNL